MPVRLNGSTSGYVDIAAPAVAGTNTLTLPAQTATIITDSSAVLNIGSGQLYKDASGNVGIGTTSPQQKLNVIGTSASLADAIRVNTSGSASVRSGIYISGNSSTTSYNWLLANQYNVSQGFEITPSTAADGNTFSTPALVVTSGGSVCIGVTGTSTSTYQEIKYTTAKEGTRYINTSSSLSTVIDFVANSAQVGSITTSGSTTAYNTSSDYRLKENVQPMTTGLATIGALKPVTYDWISDKSEGEGFIAHELQAVIPAAVTGEKDAVDEEGNIKPQGVDYSKIVVHLVAAIQELKAELDALKSKVGA